MLDDEFAFYSQLWSFYLKNKSQVKKNYKDLTKKLLAYNDPDENPKAFLRRPQYEALSMYIFIKEYLNNAQVSDMFNDWRNKQNKFIDASYYDKNGQINIFDLAVKDRGDMLFKKMKNYRESYSNYIYALAMGLGKTILMAACIFYEFLLANKFKQDKRFCHNALIFAPDKTVLQSLKEIVNLDKTKLVPPEYAKVLDANIKFHFLDETGMTLDAIDGSSFNIIISNTQKIILKKQHKQESAADKFFKENTSSLLNAVYGENFDLNQDEAALSINQRFEKLCRMPQLGVYVDEAHHLFGADLEKQMRSDKNNKANKTSLRDTINILSKKTEIIGCYNFTGTPYVENQLLPEVVYAYGLKAAIKNGYLKDADPIGFENVKSHEFLRGAVKEFWQRYGGKTYEKLNPKLAFYASSIEEAAHELRPALEKILDELKIPTSTILLNVGDERYTKNDDIKNFNDLDLPGSKGNDKQFIILVEKGKEGWNCRSLFGVALYRKAKSKIFVLQAAMRCLRAITNTKQTAVIFMSKENLDILDSELHKNFNMDLEDIKPTPDLERHKYKVKVMPPLRKIKLKRVWHEYSLSERHYLKPVNFGLKDLDLASRYASIKYTGDSLGEDVMAHVKKINADDLQDKMKYSAYSLTGLIASYLNISCILTSKILNQAADGLDLILEAVNRYNQVIYDIIIPGIFNALFEINKLVKTEEKEIILLREPKDAGYYEFTAKDELVVKLQDAGDHAGKSFHADTYCFDSTPEKRCFELYMANKDVQEIYFTGMFTAGQGELSVYYYDPESGRLRQYYPDFLAQMSDGSYRLIEVKGDNMIDNAIVKAKSEAADEMATASRVEYVMHSGSDIMKGKI